MANGNQGNLQVVVEIKNKIDGLDQEIAGMQALRGEVEKTTAVGQQQFQVAQALSKEEEARVAAVTQQLAIESQLQVIAQTRFDLTAARVKGDATQVELLNAELGIRNATLGVMRAETLSQAELNKLTTTEAGLLAKSAIAAEATAAGGLLAGAQLNRAKGEAITLAREIATGSVNARTLGALLGAMGTSITIAALVGYELYQVIGHAGDFALELAKDVEKGTEDLIKQQKQWRELALAAGDFGDVIKLGEKIQPELDKAAEKLAEFRAKELTAWQKFFDWITKQWSEIPGFGPQFNKAALEDAKSTADLLDRLRLASANKAIDAAQREAAAWEQVKVEPLSQAIDEYTKKLDTLRAKQAGIDRTKSTPDFDAWVAVGKQIELAQKRLDELTKSQTKLGGETENWLVKERQAAIDEAKLRGEDVTAAQHQLDVDKKIGELRKTNQLALKEGKVTQAEINALAEREVTNAEREKAAKSGVRDAQKDLNAQLREQAALIESIHQKQQLIDANVFLSPDQKQAATLESMRAEMAALDAQIAADKELLKGSTLDPETYERVLAEVQKLQFQYDLLGVKTQALSKPFSAELATYFNSFGTSAKQAADVVTGSLNAALQGTNQLLLDAAFRTGKWQQTVVGVERQIAQLFITFIEKQAEQFLAAEIQKLASKTTSVAAGGQIADAHAPAAAAVGISSYGVAGLVAEVIVVAAIAAIMAALGGGFEEGGFTGGRRRKFAGAVHGEEFVFPADVVDKLGVPFLEQLVAASKGTSTAVVKAESTGFDPRDFEGGIPRGGIDIGGGYGPGGGAPYWPGEVVVRQPPSYIGSVPTPAPYVPPGWVQPRSGGGYPTPSGGASGDWAQNATRTTPAMFRSGGVDPGYIDPHAANLRAFAHADWNRGMWQANPTGGEPGLFGDASAKWLAKHPIGAGWWSGAHGKGAAGVMPVKHFHEGGLLDDERLIIGKLGEYMMNDRTVDHYGLHIMELLNSRQIPRIKLHDGGSVPDGFGFSSSSSNPGMVQPIIKIIPYIDVRDVQNEIEKSTGHKTYVVDVMKGAVHEVGINAV
jgi:hypothetical protein